MIIRRLCETTEKTMEHEGDGDTDCNWRARHSYQRVGSGIRRLRNERKNGDRPNNSVVDISQNIEKSPGDLRRLTVTQISVEYQLTLE